MSLFKNILLVLERLPIEKLLFRENKETSLERLEMLVKTQPPTPKPQVSKPELITEPTSEAKQGSAQVSYEELVDYQKRELGKQLALMQIHLEQHCKINGQACDCCEKHPTIIEGLAQESLGITGNPVYTEVSQWVQKVAPKVTAEASASGKFEDDYPQMAIEARALRKKVVGTTKVAALLDKSQTQKVHQQVKEIVAKKPKGGGNKDDTRG